MTLATAMLWVMAGTTMVALNAFAIALTIRRFSISSNDARRLMTRTLLVRLALQALVLYGAVRSEPIAVVGWLFGHVAGRAVMVGWAMRRADALGAVLRRG